MGNRVRVVKNPDPRDKVSRVSGGDKPKSGGDDSGNGRSRCGSAKTVRDRHPIKDSGTRSLSGMFGNDQHENGKNLEHNKQDFAEWVEGFVKEVNFRRFEEEALDGRAIKPSKTMAEIILEQNSSGLATIRNHTLKCAIEQLGMNMPRGHNLEEMGDMLVGCMVEKDGQSRRNLIDGYLHARECTNENDFSSSRDFHNS